MINSIRFNIFFFLLIGLLVPNYGQKANTVNNLHVQPPMISGGAESSILLEKLKREGNTSLDYKKEISTEALSNQKTPDALTAINTIEGINFDEDAANSGSYHIPPDPIGVIGPNHLVSVNNTSIEVFTKSGTKVSSKRLGKNSTTAVGSFFESLSPLTATFDPKVLYDQYEDRFVVVTLERTTDPNTSHIYLAVSQTSDPNAGWYFYSINSLVNLAGVDYWADYPGFAIGEDAIYITNNLYSHASGTYGGGRLWTVDKGVTSGLYSGGTGSFVISDPFAGDNGYQMTLQPAHMFGTPPAGIGTYLVGYSRLSTGTNSYVEVYEVSNPVSAPVISPVKYVNFGAVDNFLTIPDAPQLGSTILVSTNDPRTFNAVWRNNSLYTSTFVMPPSGPDAGQVTAHWVQVNTTGYTLIDNGNIGGEDIGAGTYTFFPSIAVNAIGEMMIGFAASGPSIYPGAYYTFRFPYDAAGTVQSTKTLRAGDDYYVRTFTSESTGSNRWGDYSGSSVDPTNDITFCLFNEYAMARGTALEGEDGRWATVFGIMPNLDLTVLLEGPYAGGGAMTTGAIGVPLTQPYNVAPWNYQGQESITTLPPNIADWVLITLKKDLNPALPDPLTAVDIASRAAFLKIDGTIVDINGSGKLGFSVEPGDYYVVVEHRNHLAVMTPTAITIN